MWGTIIMPCCIVVLLTYGLPVVYVPNINIINLALRATPYYIRDVTLT
jgi:hypothetical protein